MKNYFDVMADDGDPTNWSLVISDSIYTDNSSNSPYTNSVLIVCDVSCVLSILGSFLIFGTYVAMPEIRNFTRKLVTWLTLADFLTATGYIISTTNYMTSPANSTGSEHICLVQSFITSYSSLVSFILTMMTAVHIFTTVVKQPDFPGTRRLVLFNAIGWIFPAVIIAVAGSEHVLGESNSRGTGPWCWVKVDGPHDRVVLWQVVTGKGLEITCYIVTTSLYVLLKLYLFIRHRHERFRTFHASLRDEDANFLYVWFIFYIIRIWGTIRFFISAIAPETSEKHMSMKVLLHMQAFGDPAQAFCNSILFCVLDETVRRRLFGRFSRRMCNYKELKESVPGTSEHSGENGRQGVIQAASSPISYGSTNVAGDDREDAHSCTYDSPLSTPCFTPRMSPASFASISSDG